MAIGLMLPFARQIQTGLIVSPGEVPRGNACNCICPFCEESVQSKRGEVNRDHFAHVEKKETPCPASFERSVIWMAERIFTEGASFQTPDYQLELTEYVGFELVSLKRLITASKEVEYACVDVHPLQNTGWAEKQFCLELDVGTHKLGLILHFGRTSAVEVFAENTAIIAIDLVETRTIYEEQKHGFKDHLEHFLLLDTRAKRWVFHPREIGLRSEFEAAKEKAMGRLRTPAHLHGFAGGVAMESHKNSFRSGRETYQTPEMARRRQAALDEWERLREQRENDEAESIEFIRRNSKPRAVALAEVAREMLSRGFVWGYQCNSCFIMQPGPRKLCFFCGHSGFQSHRLRTEMMLNLAEQYHCRNIGEHSLKALPDLEYPIPIADPE